MSQSARQREKIRLMEMIIQQRLDLSASRKEWLRATASIDRGWLKIVDMKKYLIVGSSLLAVYGVRHPSKVVRWARRAVGIWGTVKLFRRTFNVR
jgi:hypothetical protein